MARPRSADSGLPRYVYLKGGAYRFDAPGAKSITLGKDLTAALAAYADLTEDAAPTRTMAGVIARFVREELPTKGARNQLNYKAAIPRLIAVFGKMKPKSVKPKDVYDFFLARGRNTAARHDALHLSHIFTCAKQWGDVDFNPCFRLFMSKKKDGVRKKRKPPVTDEMFATVRAVMPPQIQCAMDISLEAGLRMTDVLALERSHITAKGIVIDTSKTDVPLLIRWSPELRAAVDRALSLRPQVRQAVIAKPTSRGGGRAGQPYTESGFGSVWQKHVLLAYPKGTPGRWSFRHIRAKNATDEQDITKAQKRLGHTSEQQTRDYIRAPQPVSALRRPIED